MHRGVRVSLSHDGGCGGQDPGLAGEAEAAASNRRDELQVEQEEVDHRVDVVPDHATDARAEQEKGRASTSRLEVTCTDSTRAGAW